VAPDACGQRSADDQLATATAQAGRREDIPTATPHRLGHEIGNNVSGFDDHEEFASSLDRILAGVAALIAHPEADATDRVRNPTRARPSLIGAGAAALEAF